MFNQTPKVIVVAVGVNTNGTESHVTSAEGTAQWRSAVLSLAPLLGFLVPTRKQSYLSVPADLFLGI